VKNNKPKIVFASVLKPINDVRMYKKMALSIPDSEIHIVGFKSEIPQNSNIHFYPIFNFNRLSVKRLFAPLQFFILLLKIRPQTIVICTHELLEIAVFYKFISGAKLIYDIQENYYLNIIHSGSFKSILRYPIAFKTRITEWFCAPFINLFVLAEKTYLNELPFVKKRYLIFENLPLEEDLIFPKKEYDLNTKSTIEIIYSGTISESYGVFEAINFAKKVFEFDKRIKLYILGYSSQKTLIEKVNLAIKNSPFIILTTAITPVEHSLIIDAIAKADIAILPYQFNKSTENRIPTKLWECIALKTPIIMSKNNNCEIIISQYEAGITLDISAIDSNTWNDFLNKKYYTNDEKIEYWDRKRFTEVLLK
jgi:glycogen synthase